MVKDVVTTTGHVIDNGIGVDADTSSSASLNHVTKLLSRAAATSKFVGNWLIVKPPRIKFTVLGPLIGEYRLRDGENLYAHPASLGQVLTLLLNVLVRPAEHFYNSTFLAVLVDRRLVYSCCLPNEIDGLKSNGIVVAVIVGGFHYQGQRVCSKGAASGEGV